MLCYVVLYCCFYQPIHSLIRSLHHLNPPLNPPKTPFTGLPFALVASCFADVEKGEETVPLVQLGVTQPADDATHPHQPHHSNDYNNYSSSSAFPHPSPGAGASASPVFGAMSWSNSAHTTTYRPPRCERCMAYVNPLVTWTHGGNQWCCNLCSHSNITPPWYFCSVDGAGIYDTCPYPFYPHHSSIPV